MLRPLMRIIGLTTLLLAGAVAHGQSPGNSTTNRVISLSEAIDSAVQNNLDVQIFRYNPKLSQFALSGSYAVYEPALSFSATRAFRSSAGGTDAQGRPFPSRELESTAFAADVGPGVSGYTPWGMNYGLSLDLNKQHTAPPGSSDYSGGAGISLSQPLLRDFWIDQPRATVQLNKKNLKISDWQLRDQLMTTIVSVEQAYYNLIFTRENVRVQRTALELADQLLRENKKRVEVGALAPLDEKQAEAEVATTRAQLIDAERQLAQQQNILKNLITDKYGDWQGVTLDPVENLVAVPSESNLGESWRRALTMRPDLQQLKLDLEKRDITLRFQKNQLWPALDLTGSYGHTTLNNNGYGRAFRDLPDGSNPNYSVGVVMSIPLGNRRARYNLESAKAEKEQALLGFKKAEQGIMVEIDDAVRLIRSNFEKVEATRAARAFAQEALDAERKKLENGKSTSFFVLQFQRDLTARRYDEIRALADYNNALAQLAYKEGATLDRHSIRVDSK